MDLAFADLAARLDPGAPEDLHLAAALASRAVGQGHSCLDLAVVDLSAADPSPDFTPLKPEAWARSLAQSRVVGAPGEFAPLILSGHRLYLSRFFEAETRVARALSRLMAPLDPPPDPGRLAEMAKNLDRLFPTTEPGPDWQKTAAAVASLRRLAVISGGPGTGKTRTVARILALWALENPGKPLRVALAAPTGKAAARLAESVARARDELAGLMDPGVLAAIPSTARTLHRLLGVRPLSGFLHNAQNPLAVDAVVVDEASMVDLSMLAALADALPLRARLVLLGDRDQLSSVAPGAVMGDLCPPGRGNAFSQEFARELSLVTGADLAPWSRTDAPAMGDCVVILEKSFRFGPDTAVGRLAVAVNTGDADAAREALETGAPDLTLVPVTGPRSLAAILAEPAVRGFSPYLSVAGPEEAARLFSGFRVLCAVREGPFGVKEANRAAERILSGRGLLAPRGPWYPGRPVLVTQNDYDLGLFNGDTGLYLDGRVHFPGPDGPRSFSPLVLPPHETVFAMTVHKSQGSEFADLLVILPHPPSPAATRQLLYTACTRSRGRLTLVASPAALDSAITTPTLRHSGLADALWEGNRE